jgi:glucosamine--fructose-6-phosphate aminotransferase (isomerizing)
MSGIVAYIGKRRAVPILLDSLRRLEYRGYDSAGLAVVGDDGALHIRRAPGKLRNLEEGIRLSPVDGSFGIGHTRWATHGRPTEENAHPHRDCRGEVAVVHNGIIENYLALKPALVAEGPRFRPETDTEVVAHLVEKHFDDDLESAVRKTVAQLTGVFALAVISSRDPNKIVVARQGPPAVVGLGDGEYLAASDVPALLGHTRAMFFLNAGEMVVLSGEGVHLTDFDGQSRRAQVSRILWDPIMAEKGGFPHFMLKEIYEQPRAVRDTVAGRIRPETGRVVLDDMNIAEREFREFQSLRLVACGSSWHSALAGTFMIEKLARIPVEAHYASEFRYRDPIVGPETLVVGVSQSGEAADTIAAQREARRKGARTMAVCNVIGSMLTREAAGTILTHAGPEISVASTKAFTSQLTALFLLAMYLGQTRETLDPACSQHLAQELLRIPEKLERVLSNDSVYDELTKLLFRADDFLFLGRGIHFPVAFEGALKLKEISYIHAEAYPAGEMKHGPNALIDERLPAVVLATRDLASEESNVRFEKTLSNMQEVKARGGTVGAVACEGDSDVASVADHVLWVPVTDELLLPILEIVPLQLLAYHIAVRRGCDVDQPRNLAKSVTVE